MILLIDVIRKVVPIRVRQDFGLWTAKCAGKSKLIAYPYFFLLCGKIPHNLKLLPNGDCSVIYSENEIVAPRDGILAFIEVLQDKVYEKFWSPRVGDIVLDIGAYVGMFTLRAAKLVGDTGMVIAIEPEPRNLSYLKRNVESLSNVRVIEEAISNRIGEGMLHISNATPCHTLIHPHKKSMKVKVNTIDNIVTQLNLPHIDFIKMDIEGAGLQALEGAKHTLRGRVKLAIAAYHQLSNRSPELPHIINLLKSIRYQTHISGGYVYAERNNKKGKGGNNEDNISGTSLK